MIQSDLKIEGQGFKSFKKEREALENATRTITCNFSKTPIEICYFKGCDRQNLIFSSIGSTRDRQGEPVEKQVRLKADKMHPVLLKEIQAGVVPLMLLIDRKFFVFIDIAGAKQLLNKFKCSLTAIDKSSRDTAIILYNNFKHLQKEAKVALRTDGGFFKFLNLYVQKLEFIPACTRIYEIASVTQLTVAEWNIAQDETSVVLRGAKIGKDLVPMIEARFADCGKTNREVLFGITTPDGKRGITIKAADKKASPEEIDREYKRLVKRITETLEDQEEISVEPIVKSKDVRSQIGKKRDKVSIGLLDESKPMRKYEAIKLTLKILDEIGELYQGAKHAVPAKLGAIVDKMILD